MELVQRDFQLYTQRLSIISIYNFIVINCVFIIANDFAITSIDKMVLVCRRLRMWIGIGGAKISFDHKQVEVLRSANCVYIHNLLYDYEWPETQRLRVLSSLNLPFPNQEDCNNSISYYKLGKKN